MTPQQLEQIDVMVCSPALPHETHCLIPHPEVDLFNEALRAEGFVSYAGLAPFRGRRKFESSLWVRMADNRCVPELYALAVLKFGDLNDRRPYWTDGSPTNNTIENISLASAARPGKFGKMFTSPAHKKDYYADPINRVRHREVAKRSAKKKREELAAARKALEGPLSPLEELKRRILQPDGRRGDDDDRDTVKTMEETQELPTVADMIAELVKAKREEEKQ